MKLAAKLLFQFRVVVNGSSGTNRQCEIRYIVIDNVINIDDSIEQLFVYGKKKNYSYINTDRNKVYFEFIGVMDYILMEEECDDNEFWYDFCGKKLPMENRKTLTKTKNIIKKEIKEYIISKTEPPVSSNEKNRYRNVHVYYPVQMKKDK
jgi:hypothetical protein